MTEATGFDPQQSEFSRRTFVRTAALATPAVAWTGQAGEAAAASAPTPSPTPSALASAAAKKIPA
ncbi:hypothetical protein ACWEPC_59375, partial [Nonomuraea sp. NPDC004297]